MSEVIATQATPQAFRASGPPARKQGQVCVAGVDLVRVDGEWLVLEDNLRTPSGISYVLENRLAMTRLMPELFEGHRIRTVDNYLGRVYSKLGVSGRAELTTAIANGP